MGGKAVIHTLVASAISLAAFVVLAKCGFSSDLSLFVSLGLAGALNIGRLATLNPELVLPTSCGS
ncbi:MAG: hypothetical protein JO167_03765 [Alphaproteobacteria bacterium]|nr:hypothetical protein [Alphaproteobacteria bacterium]MBV9905503.1 hypothetical protein [Alphaproteobacteria bacterium]